MQRLQGLFDWHRQGVDKDLWRLERKIGENEDKIDGGKKSINSGFRWLALGAGGSIFEPVHKGITF